MTAHTFNIDSTSFQSENQEARKQDGNRQAAKTEFGENERRAAGLAARLLLIWILLALAGCAAGVPQPSTTTPQPPTPTPSAGEPPVTASIAPNATATAPAPNPNAAAATTPADRPTPQPSPATGSPTETPDPCSALPTQGDAPAYRLQAVAELSAHRLRVYQQVTLTDPTRLATGEIRFNVLANHAAGVFTLMGVRLAGDHTPLTAILTDTTLRVELPAALRDATTATLCLDFTLNLSPAADTGGITAAHALGWSDLGDVAGAWYPLLAPYAAGTGWILTPYHPVGDPLVAEAADYAVTVTAPAGYAVIGAGLQSAQAGVWEFRLPATRAFAFVVTDRLVVTQADVDGIPVRIYHLPEHQAAAQDALTAAGEALPLFVRTFGAYPYADLTIVEAVQFGGMEYSGLITFSSQWFADYRSPAEGEEFGADFLIRFVVHEIGHQWWYAAVGNNQATEPWLDEALARFGEWLYYAQLHPAHLAWWEAPSAGMATVPLDQPIYNFQDTTSYVQAVYVSGTRFLLAVRDRMGEAAFTAFLRDYYRQHRGRLVSGAEFLATLRAHAGPALDDLLPAYFGSLR